MQNKQKFVHEEIHAAHLGKCEKRFCQKIKWKHI